MKRPRTHPLDVPKHVHNVSDDSHNPTHRPSICFDAHSINLIKNTEDTSVRCVSTTLLATDTSKGVYHLPTSLNEVTDQCMRRFDMSSNTGHQENDKDMFSRRVPSSFLTRAAGRRMMTSATLPSTEDILKCVHSPSINSYELTYQHTMRRRVSIITETTWNWRRLL